jgi:PPK2 family polyphosphate:nucleotide phosphotransferase
MHIDRFRVRAGDRAALKQHDPVDTGPFSGKDEARAHLQKGVTRLDTLQERLYAQGQYALLLIFQGMDGAGKDSAIRHVMSGVSPQGTDVHAFKQPSAEELDHDYLWRAVKVLPGRGRIGIFNRSYYEEVLVVRVHPAVLEAQKLPRPSITPRIWKERFEDINAFEHHLWRNGTIVRKFYLHISRREQRRRLLARLDNPEKHWKFSMADLAERALWKAYRDAYTDMLAATSQDPRRGTSSRRITSGLHRRSSPTSSSMRSEGSTCRCRSRTQRGGAISRTRGVSCCAASSYASGSPALRIAPRASARPHPSARLAAPSPSDMTSPTGSPRRIIPSRTTSALSARWLSKRWTISLSTLGFTSRVSGSMVVM